MGNKRYAIVRVDGICPLYLEQRTYKCEMGNFTCENCYTYGDTKEQLIKKVAQVIFKAKLERYRQVWKCECSEMEKRNRYKGSLILARKIVESLGVEE